MSLDQWSQTPASNDLANYFQTGMAPSKVKNAGWDVMADACAVIGTGSMPTSGGSANAQTITNTRAYGALFTGMWAVFVPGFTNTGAMTLQVDGLTAKNVFANGADALAGQVVSGIQAWCRYDGTQWQLVNPQRSTGSFTITLTGFNSNPTGTVNYAISPDGKTAFISIRSSITNTGSNATTMTGTGIPSILSAASAGHRMILEGEDNTIVQLCAVGSGLNGTTWTFALISNSGAWTAAGTKGILTNDAFYTLD